MAKLFVVGTPIGNLEDITIRALRVLKEVDAIACEDTRVTKKLLNHYQINNKKLFSYHDKNEKFSSKGLIKLILEGKNIAQVSDAGMPVINDPGFNLIKEAIINNVAIEVIPGPSASLTALVLSNFDSHFTYHGFLSFKKEKNKNQLKSFEKGTHIIFSSRYKIISELENIQEVFGKNINIFIGREMTKLHETHYRGNIIDIIEKIKKNPKGEFTIVLEIKKNFYDQ